MEKIVSFEISGEQYTLFIEGIFKKHYYLQKEEEGSMFAEPIPVKVSASTLKDSVAYWLEILKTKKMSVENISQKIRNHLKKAIVQSMSPEDIKAFRKIADQEQEESHIYVSERITNISALEKLMERERIAVSALIAQIQKEALSRDEIKERLDKILQLQDQVCSFEFCVERRRTKGCIL